MDEPAEFIGLDIGSKFIGVARGNTLAKLAEPLATWPSTEARASLAKLASEKRLAGVVVGLPRGLNGQETDQTKTVRQWVHQTKVNLEVPFFWQDEALTSLAAARLPAGQNSEHAMAAAVILQDFLESDENVRMVA